MLYTSSGFTELDQIPAWVSTQLADIHLSHRVIYTLDRRLFKAGRKNEGANSETDQYTETAFLYKHKTTKKQCVDICVWTCPT